MCHWRQILESDDNHLAMLWFIEEVILVDHLVFGNEHQAVFCDTLLLKT